ncbi:MAG TPA: GNAT family N-acetyltransferase [Anaerolineales bacterium]|nr:GNAT family N-acetyltransferase [Anaerolineales bacterium]
MFDYFILAYHLAREAIAEGKLSEFFGHQVFRNRIVIPVEMDLRGPLADPRIPSELDIRFVEFQPEDIQAGKWMFPVSSRRVKASRNLKRGLRGFALVQNGKVVGDLWCVCRKKNEEPVSHPDFKLLDIHCKEQEVYAFDMLIDPSYRGKNLAAPLQRSLQHALKDEGFVKVYGGYYEDNLPALWMHRMLKFKEYPKRRVSRFFSYLKSTLLNVNNTPASFAKTTKQGE